MMACSFSFRPWARLLWMLTIMPFARAEKMLTSSSLDSCLTDSSFSASLFDVVYTPNNGSLAFDINGVSVIDGYTIIEMKVIAYGYTAITYTINPCDNSEFVGICPMNVGSIVLKSTVDVPESAAAEIPGIAYTIPDLDAKVQVRFMDNDTSEVVACVEAKLSNGQTVYQKGVGWALAVISGLALTASAIASSLGHDNTSAHIAANALSLFGYFQAQALAGMTAVTLPPIVASWTQNFQWSMGIIAIDFIQSIATWYQRATGGTPSTIIADQDTTSVDVEKRSLLRVRSNAYTRSLDLHQMMKRTTNTANTVIVRGIERVGFKAGIEETNIFMTGYIFFLFFVILVAIGVVAFKYILEGLAKAGKVRPDQFRDFRNGWTTVLKGTLYRIVQIGFPQMVVLCFWEFTQDDSSAEIALAAITIIAVIGLLGWAASKIILTAQRSIALHNTPSYILYSDPACLNKWGFLYVQFKATACFFIVPVLVHILIKGMFIALSQKYYVVQAVALVIIEALFLIGVSVLRPYMDKKTNAFNIGICATNLISAIFLLVFTDVFGLPGLVTGVMGVIFFVYNAVFATVLLVLVLVASIFAITTRNPDMRYQPMRDDRSVFMKSQTHLPTELDALGTIARGDGKNWHDSDGGSARIEDDDDDVDHLGRWRSASQTAGAANIRPATAEPPQTPVATAGIGIAAMSGGESEKPPAYNYSTPGQQSQGGGTNYQPLQQQHSGAAASPGLSFRQQQGGASSPAPTFRQQQQERAGSPAGLSFRQPQGGAASPGLSLPGRPPQGGSPFPSPGLGPQQGGSFRPGTAGSPMPSPSLGPQLGGPFRPAGSPSPMPSPGLGSQQPQGRAPSPGLNMPGPFRPGTAGSGAMPSPGLGPQQGGPFRPGTGGSAMASPGLGNPFRPAGSPSPMPSPGLGQQQQQQQGGYFGQQEGASPFPSPGLSMPGPGRQQQQQMGGGAAGQGASPWKRGAGYD